MKRVLGLSILLVSMNSISWFFSNLKATEWEIKGENWMLRGFKRSFEFQECIYCTFPSGGPADSSSRFSFANLCLHGLYLFVCCFDISQSILTYFQWTTQFIIKTCYWICWTLVWKCACDPWSQVMERFHSYIVFFCGAINAFIVSKIDIIYIFILCITGRSFVLSQPFNHLDLVPPSDL